MSTAEMDEMVCFRFNPVVYLTSVIVYFPYEIPVKRFTCSRVPEDGQFVAELAGTCTYIACTKFSCTLLSVSACLLSIDVVCFDNTYSWLRMKKVMYVIEVLDPVQMDEEA